MVKKDTGKIGLYVLTVLLTSSCSNFFPKTGPTYQQVYSSAVEVKSESIEPFLTVVELNPKMVYLLQNETKQIISTFNTPKYSPCLGIGDTVEIIIQEQYPPVLFPIEKNTSYYIVPAQVIGENGTINVPYAGVIIAKGKTTQALADEIREKLKNKANSPYVLVRQLSSDSSYVTVFGSVKESKKIQLSYNTTTILDVLAQAGGVVSPINKTVIRIDRKANKLSLPLEEIIKNPDLNLNLMPGDVVTVIHKNQSAMILGATQKNEEIEFESTGITLSQLIARVGGLNPNLANPQAVFVFRFEDKDIVKRMNIEKKIEIEKGVPIVYNINFGKPENFFTSKEFKIKDGDIIYVATAPSVQYQQFLNLLTNVVSPIFMIDRMGRR